MTDPASKSVFSAQTEFKVREVDFKRPVRGGAGGWHSSGRFVAPCANPPTLQPKFVVSVPFLPPQEIRRGHHSRCCNPDPIYAESHPQFRGSLPHVSVATLVPADPPIPIPTDIQPMT
jgi:hypothetical protein